MTPEREAALERVLDDALVALPVLATVLERIECFGGARLAREMIERAKEAR